MAKRNGYAPPTGQLITLATMLVALVALMVLKSRCGMAVEQMFRAIEAPGAPSGVGDGGRISDGGHNQP
jgi:hypothetical protein